MKISLPFQFPFFLAVITTCISFASCQKNGNIIAEPFAKKPNIVFILGDDIGYEVPQCNGGSSYSTPNINALAQNGMRFTQCHTAPLCSPSRVMLLTGKYNFRNYTTWGSLDAGNRTIANILKAAGYATCVAGKWQLGGGDNSIRSFGFDKYSVWLPFLLRPEELEGSRYKSPKIYQDNNYLPATATEGLYSEDIFADYVKQFIQDNKQHPFFIYYSMILSHKAFSPTPNDPEYAAWNADPNNSDAAFYPSMISYMDKKIGEVVQKLENLGLLSNTVIIYAGDNGVQKEITSLFNDTPIQGGKGSTIEYGTHVPLIIQWPAKIAPGSVNNQLIDFPDFMPTLAKMAGTTVPASFGITDGVDFYSQLTGNISKARSWSFCHFQPMLNESGRLIRWVQNTQYKLYADSSFYNINSDIYETTPLKKSTLTNNEKKLRKQFLDVLATMHN